MAPWPDAGGSMRAHHMSAVRLIMAAALGLGLVVVIILFGLSDVALRAGWPKVAVRLTGTSGRAAAALAVRRQEQGDAASAAVLARQALATSLVHVDALRVLGLVDEARGERRRAAAMMALAGRGGWRDAPTQLWLVQQGLRTGDHAAVALRTDALLRMSIARPDLFVMIGIAAGDPGLRAAFIERLATHPGWRMTFFQHLDASPPSVGGSIDALIRGLGSTAAPASRAELSSYLNRLESGGELGRAYGLRKDLFGQYTALEWPDAEILANPLPFDWKLAQLSGAMIRVEGRQLVVQAMPDAAGVVASRRLFLTPGAYYLSFSGADAAAWRWALRCPGGETRLFPVVHATGQIRLRFDRPTCPGPILELGLADTGRARPAELRIGAVDVARAEDGLADRGGRDEGEIGNDR